MSQLSHRWPKSLPTLLKQYCFCNPTPVVPRTQSARHSVPHCAIYSIASSAIASSVGSTSRPRALAVLRLMTISESARKLHRQVARLLALEDAIDIAGHPRV